MDSKGPQARTDLPDFLSSAVFLNCGERLPNALTCVVLHESVAGAVRIVLPSLAAYLGWSLTLDHICLNLQLVVILGAHHFLGFFLSQVGCLAGWGFAMRTPFLLSQAWLQSPYLFQHESWVWWSFSLQTVHLEFLFAPLGIFIVERHKRDCW